MRLQPNLIDLGFQSDTVLGLDIVHDVLREGPDLGPCCSAVVDEHQSLLVVDTTCPSAMAFPTRPINEPSSSEFHLAFRRRIMSNIRVISLNAFESRLGHHGVFEKTSRIADFPWVG